MLLMDEEELYGLCRTHFTRYFWGAVQCVGDGASEVALKVFHKIKSEPDVPRLLKRIDMASALKDDDITAISRNEVIPVTVPGQIISDREWAMRNLGSETRLLYRFKSLLKAGARLAFASDAPSSSIDPLNGIYCAVERRGWGEGPEFRFYPKEGIPVGDAVAAFTMGSARACGMDAEVGSIEPGKRADLVHLSHDIFTDDAAVIKRAKVMEVYVDGERAPG
jgi:predicted amidohydrolase YtcJ